MRKSGRGVSAVRTIAALALGAAGVLQSTAAGAFSFDLGGDIQGAFDTDVTYGFMRRMESAQPDTKGASYGNRVLFPDKGDILSNAIRVSHTLELKRGDTGYLMRGNYFYDGAFRNKDLPTDVANSLRHSQDITDAFFYTKLGDNVGLRVGKQVINWGESTFIQGGIADINTFDIKKLRVPGADLKDAFVGANAVNVSWSDSNWTVEGFGLFKFDSVRVDPMGSPFATLDAIGDGGGFDLGGNGVPGGGCTAADNPTPAPGTPRCDLLGGFLVRTSDKRASNSGQWGIAVRKFFPDFFNGGEVALYMQNLHDHLPMISSYGRSGQFFVDYPEDIKRYGISFNTNVAGLAIGGEYSMRKDAPIQLVQPLLNGLVPAQLGPFAPDPATVPGSYQQGWTTSDRHQMQITVQKNWGVVHQLGADAGSSIIEVAFGRLSDLPGKTLLFEPTLTKSWSGMQMRHSLTYQAALFNLVALTPNFAYRWDMNGNSNELGGAKAFVDGRRASTIGLDFDYMAGRYKGGISYTSFHGRRSEKNLAGGLLNGAYDRDFIQANVSMSF
ncbi:MAG: DUF1302 family protein [Rugosibacter sp.]|nr:DUF1302 family protein [Rugosibacter sp.]